MQFSTNKKHKYYLCDLCYFKLLLFVWLFYCKIYRLSEAKAIVRVYLSSAVDVSVNVSRFLEDEEEDEDVAMLKVY